MFPLSSLVQDSGREGIYSEWLEGATFIKQRLKNPSKWRIMAKMKTQFLKDCIYSWKLVMPIFSAF